MPKLFFFLTFNFIVLSFISIDAQIILNEEFEAGIIPTTWSQKTVATDGGWKAGINTTLSSTKFVIPSHTKFACTNDDKCLCNKSNDMLITPYLDFTNYTKIQLSYDAFYYAVYYADGKATESAFIKASLDKGNTWINISNINPDGIWNNQIADLSSLAGKDSVKIAFVYCDGNGDSNHQLYGLAIDNIKIFVPNDFDVSAITINIPECFRKDGNEIINGYLLNRGALKIESMTINYRIDNNPVIFENLINLNVGTAKYYNYAFTTPWNPEAGIHKIKVWASNINGNPDQNLNNDTVISVNNIFKPGKPVLVEYFTNASCPSCAAYTPGLEQSIKNEEDFVIGLSYHTSWPGTDPMQTSVNIPDIQTRVNFYGVHSVPSAIVDGTISTDQLVNQSECPFAVKTSKDTAVIIENPVSFLNGNNLNCSATFIAKKNLSGYIRVYIAVVEKQINFTNPPGANGQKSFDWVMKKMLPNANGTALPSIMKNGYSKTITGSWTLTGTIYNRNQLRIIFFVQNITTKEVLWTSMVSNTVGIQEHNNINFAEIFPNPIKDKANISFNLDKPENIKIIISDMLGHMVITKDLGLVSVGKNNYKIDIGNIKSGIYIVEINSGKESIIRKISIIK